MSVVVFSSSKMQAMRADGRLSSPGRQLAASEDSCSISSSGWHLLRTYGRLSSPRRHLAASEGSYKVTEWLLEEGVTVNALDRFKRTPLEDAVRGDFTDLSKLLIDHGGKVWTEGKVSTPCVDPKAWVKWRVRVR